jgi:hypothetical protein
MSNAYSLTVTYLVTTDAQIVTNGVHTGQPPGLTTADQPVFVNGIGVLPPITLDVRTLPGALSTMTANLAVVGLYHHFTKVAIDAAAGNIVTT